MPGAPTSTSSSHGRREYLKRGPQVAAPRAIVAAPVEAQAPAISPVIVLNVLPGVDVQSLSRAIHGRNMDAILPDAEPAID